MESREQKLIDICFAIGLAVRADKKLQSLSQEELAEWIAKQLRESGFPTTPQGASWGVLDKR